MLLPQSGESHLFQAILKKTLLILKLEFCCWPQLCNQLTHSISPLILMHFALTQRTKENPARLPHSWSSPQNHRVTADNFRSLQVVSFKPTWKTNRGSSVKPDKLWQFYHSVPDPGRQQASLDDRSGRVWSADGSLQHSQQGISPLLPLPTFSWYFCMAQIYQLGCFTGLSTQIPITYKSIESVL